jgi:uncharacterized protein YwgA
MAPLPIVYLYTSDNQGISGAIKFQKLVFLGQQESELPDRYRFIPYKFGPYSYQLERDIETAINSGYIRKNRVQNSVGNYRIDYSLTTDGVQQAKGLLNKHGFDKLFKEAKKVTSEHGSKSLSDLLNYVYRNYPDYIDESTLDIERLFDEATTSQFAEQDQSRVGPFDLIKKLSEKEGKVAGLNKKFTRQSLQIGSEFQATLERISGDSLSIYWRSSSPSLDSFIGALKTDPCVSEDAPSEMRTRESGDWIRGGCGELLERLDSQECLFFRTKAENERYTITWEAGRGTSGDEITIYMSNSRADYEHLRAALVRYATTTVLGADMAPESRVSTTDEMIDESIRQTAKLAIS